MSAIHSDAETTPTALNADTASELFLKQWEAAPGAPAKTVEGDKDASDSMDAGDMSDDEDILLEDDEGTEDPTSDDTDQPLDGKIIEDDDAMFKVLVDGEEKVVSAKELKRLAGQEASLTRKSMELAARRKEAEEIGAYHAQGLANLVKMAEDEYRPYANIDFLVAAKELNAEELKALREEATAKYQKYQYLTSELQHFTQRTAEQRSRMMHEQAQATIQELSSPETGIPGWGPKLYEEVGNYAISNGMRPEVFTSILDAPSLRMLYDAYRYDRARKVKTTKKAQAPQKVLRSSASADSGRFGNDKAKASISKLRQSGSREDAAAALLSRWGVE